MKNLATGLVTVLVLGAAVYYWWTNKVPVDNSGLSNNPASTTVFNYSCNEGKTITATITSGEVLPPARAGEPPQPTGKAKVELSDGRQMNLVQTISADGVRYANSDESFVFWLKGNGVLVLENNQTKTYIGCVLASPLPANSNLKQIYSNGSLGFSLRLPQFTIGKTADPSSYRVDENYLYQPAPDKKIGGVKFTIPSSLTTGTNLSTDSYLSVEVTPQAPRCTADLFLSGSPNSAQLITDGGRQYSVAKLNDAAAGNRYDETVYAIPNTNPCLAIRYLIHYGNIQNYDPGTIKEFDETGLVSQFDQIRRSLIINQ